MGTNPTQTLHQTIQKQFGLPNPGDSSKSSNDCHPTTTTQPQHRFVIPQLKIPQLQLQQQQPTDLAAQERSRQATDLHNQQLLDEIRRRRQGSESEAPPGGAGGATTRFVIPQLGAATGEPLNIPLLSRLERSVGQLQIRSDDDGGDRAEEAMKSTTQSPLIDLTSTVIAASKDGPPKVAASKAREKLAASQEHFNIPFNPCDLPPVSRNPALLSGDLLASRRRRHEKEEEEASVPPPESQPGPIGCMLDVVVGYPNLQYAITALERHHLKMCNREDYGGQVKRFRFDTPSPDELVKQALQKSWRVTRT
ncbi:uncharacterized protein [Drosophila kikkawai]|uniref:Uncharacterized protein n=1 Tax=Drosophila kikkawai TaxID=30033 RepID=A0A6P4JHX0_DROKI|nr:uncharacterized protein LOC108083786 [Drosophila kikkawai]